MEVSTLTYNLGNLGFWMCSTGWFKQNCFRSQCWPNVGRGGKVIWTKSKRTADFFRETVPHDKIINDQRVVKFSTFLRSVGALLSPFYAPRASAWQNTIFLTGDFVLCSMLLLMLILLLMWMLILPPFVWQNTILLIVIVGDVVSARLSFKYFSVHFA